MIKVSTTGMAVSLKTDLRFPISGQWGHGDRIIHTDRTYSDFCSLDLSSFVEMDASYGFTERNFVNVKSYAGR